MTRYLLDTGIMSDFINRRRGVDVRVAEARQQGARIGTCLPVVGELFGGVEASASREKNHPRLIAALSRIVCWPFDRFAAETFGRLFAELKRRGQLIDQINLQTAAIALNLGDCTVVTKDTDFDRVPGLTVANWAS